MDTVGNDRLRGRPLNQPDLPSSPITPSDFSQANGDKREPHGDLRAIRAVLPATAKALSTIETLSLRTWTRTGGCTFLILNSRFAQSAFIRHRSQAVLPQSNYA
jgi:hypothetical protein